MIGYVIFHTTKLKGGKVKVEGQGQGLKVWPNYKLAAPRCEYFFLPAFVARILTAPGHENPAMPMGFFWGVDQD